VQEVAPTRRVKSSTSQIVRIRGLGYHVRRWGPERAPKLFMLHGWMDVGASFQFLVDALAGDWSVIAPDWRGFGKSEWCADGYWFADYIADLEAIVERFAPHEAVRLLGHSLGGNVVTLYAGIRPERVAKVVSLDGFGIPAEGPGVAPAKYVKWLDALRDPPGFASYASLGAVADRLQAKNPRLSRDKAEFLATHWAQAAPGGGARLVSDPRHKLPFPIVYRMEEVRAVWARVTAPVLWVGASDSFVSKWLGEGEEGVRQRMRALRDCRLVTIPDAGHMLHHDQPAAVAAVIEPFFAA